MSIEVGGKLRITSIDANTGKILDVDEGSNLVLKSGSVGLANLITGLTVLPVGERIAAEGQVIRDFIGPVPDIVKFVQFGTRSTPVTYNDISPWENGTLDANSVSPNPANASPIVEISKDNIGLGTDGTIQFTCILDSSKGNSLSGNVTYTEAVLMGLAQVSPFVKYKWFARRVFPGKIKNSSIALKADWFLYFYVKEAIS